MARFQIIPDRLSVGHVLRDYWRSMKLHSTGHADVAARYLLIVLPILGFVLSVGAGIRITQPALVLPATSLLSGVLLAASGQLISLRARIADSVVLSQDTRVLSMFREALSGVLTAALAAFAVTILLILSGVLPAGSSVGQIGRYLGVVVSGLVVGFGIFLALVFFSSVRRLYSAYLEAFEGGLPLMENNADDDEQGPSGDGEEDRTQLDQLEIPESGRRSR